MIADDIARAAGDPATSDRAALIAGDQVVSYRELWRRVERVRAWFAARFAPGDRIALVLDNCPELVLALYGATSAGLIAVPVDASVHARNLDYVLGDAEPAAVVVAEGQRARVAAAPALAARPLHLITAGGPAAAAAASEAAAPVTPFAELLATEPDAAPAAPLDPETPALISYTTGTTGLSKGALLPHRALSAATRNINAFTGLPPGTVELVCMPLTHSFGLARLRCAFAVGGTVVLAAGLSRPGRVLDAAAARGVTSLGLVPMAVRMLMDHFRPRLAAVAPQIRVLELGSDFLERRYKEELLELFPGARICMHYGLTEASRSTFIELRGERDHLDTIGRPSPDVEVAIRGGELCVRGETLMLGYWRKPELSQEALRDGWLHTGDLAERGDGGYLRLLGRRSDVFKIAGFSVAPQEIEAVLASHPGVAEAAVTLRAAERSSAVEIAAFLVAAPGSPAPDEAELRRLCRAELEAYKVPSRFVVVEALPRTASGKLQRRELAASYAGG